MFVREQRRDRGGAPPPPRDRSAVRRFRRSCWTRCRSRQPARRPPLTADGAKRTPALGQACEIRRRDFKRAMRQRVVGVAGGTVRLGVSSATGAEEYGACSAGLQACATTVHGRAGVSVPDAAGPAIRSLVGGCVLNSAHQAADRERLDDEHVRRRRIRVHRHGARRRFDLLQRADQPVRDAGDRRAAGVGVELARPRNRRLNQHRRNRRQDDRREQRNRVAALAIVAPPPPKNIAKRDDHHDRGRQRRRHRAGEDVAMLHVRQFVRDARLRVRRRSGSAGCLRWPPRPRAPGCGRWQTRSATAPG